MSESGDDILITPGDLSDGVIIVARSQLGVKEKPPGSNSGKEIDEYLASVGEAPGVAWCAAFVYWCFQKSANALFVHNPCGKTASSRRMWELATAFQTDVPEPGCLYVLDHGNRRGHVGIIESVGPTGIITEISGNTKEQGGRVGCCVVRHIWVNGNPHGGKLLGYVNFTRRQLAAA